MRSWMLCACLSSVALIPTSGIAQVYRTETPAPQVTAVSAPWLRSGDPIFYAGQFYFPTGPTVFFDGKVMARTGNYEGVPLYADVTLEPYSVVFVPIGGNLMRPYERRRNGDLAGTVGSRVPSFPIQRDVELSATSGAVSFETIDRRSTEMAFRGRGSSAVGTSGTSGLSNIATDSSRETVAPFMPTGVESVPRPSSSDGLWIEFNGARWFSDGAAVRYDPTRFVPVGNYRGFSVYRESTADANRIYVTVVPDGPLAPFTRR